MPSSFLQLSTSRDRSNISYIRITTSVVYFFSFYCCAFRKNPNPNTAHVVHKTKQRIKKKLYVYNLTLACVHTSVVQFDSSSVTAHVRKRSPLSWRTNNKKKTSERLTLLTIANCRKTVCSSRIFYQQYKYKCYVFVSWTLVIPSVSCQAKRE